MSGLYFGRRELFNNQVLFVMVFLGRLRFGVIDKKAKKTKMKGTVPNFGFYVVVVI